MRGTCAAPGTRRTGVWAVVVPLGMGLFTQSWSGPAGAQSCDRACDAKLRDAHGCCPPPAPAARPAAPAPARPECSEGKAVSPDTMGHCCWPGQVWATSRCVGVPTSCPSPRALDAKAQECIVPSCPSGMTRTDDRVHCCWPGQGWSLTRDVCVGNPQCPRGFEAEESGCASVDKDGDGIPNARDKCPDEPEDMNGFEDDDGCPDEQKRIAAATDAANAAQQAAADRERQRQAAEQERQRQEAAALEAQQQREREVEAQRKSAEEEQQRRAEAVAKARQDREDAIAHAATRRAIGLGLTGVGVASGIGAFVFMALGAGENSSIQGGSLATGSAIADAAKAGSTDNTVAAVLGTVGILACAGGVPLFLSGLSSPEEGNATVSFLPVERGAGMRAVVRFR